MNDNFDTDAAKKSLIKKQEEKLNLDEQVRQIELAKIIKILKEEFVNQAIEVFLVGSITQPYKFHKNSDIDIVLKNFKGDRFDTWSSIDRKIDRTIELILYKKCHFKDHIDQHGLKVL